MTEPAGDPRWLSFDALGGRSAGPLCVVPDLDDDGWEDLVIPVYGRDAAGKARGSLAIVSTRDLAILHSSDIGDQHILDFAVADLQDGPRLVCTTTNGREQWVASLALPDGVLTTISTLPHAQGAAACVVLADSTGDGCPELLIGLPFADQSRGSLLLLDGATGQELSRCTPADWGTCAGRDLLSLPSPAPSGLPWVAVATMRGAGLLDAVSCDVRCHVSCDFETGVTALADLGDVDGDAVPDFAISCDGAGGEGYWTEERPLVIVASGADGRRLATWLGGSRTMFGGALATVGGQLLVGALAADDFAGQVVAIPVSGDGTPVIVLQGTEATGALGAQLGVASGPGDCHAVIALAFRGLVVADTRSLLSTPAVDVTRQ